MPEEDKKAIENAVEELKKIKDTGSKEEIQTKLESLNKASHKLAEEMYKEAQQAQQAQQQTQSEPEAAPADDSSAKPADVDDEDVVDADFEEVK